MSQILEEFIDAAAAGEDVLRLALYLRQVGVNDQGFEGNTALHRACIRGQLATIQFLLDQGASPNIRNNHGYTPLHHGNIYEEVCECLLANGADMTIMDNLGYTPYDTFDDTDIELVELFYHYAPTEDLKSLLRFKLDKHAKHKNE